ncbi:hypothetical protein M378DRAFT_812987 [Amanita muscaria Koide BX008]|uniref:Uncharacterized protein n=1 Tax=Amanita muscaria (strain Koide BX008) TaxID=946122 RepID=A0A0C2T5Q4_AMAMK|nr:hypothetical protein M378DRAFT_812987 [Amanita muscaria Koide BX008]
MSFKRGGGSTATNNSHNITFVNCNFASNFLTGGKTATEVNGLSLITEVQLLNGQTQNVANSGFVLLSNNQISTLDELDTRGMTWLSYS